MNSSDERSWRAIFDLLRKQAEPEVGGRAGLTEESRSKLQSFARGALSPEEIQNLCREIVEVPEALDLLARMLKKIERENLSDGVL